MIKFIDICFWRYLFENNTGWNNVWCRFREHPAGPVYYTSLGIEPDFRCKNCGEHIH